ncbi:hypothetical protein SESBI_07142 [Sesbania bispinosa]|nr:hypothetical protein SESBI_07142 [Sesbania bispinosa]
MSSTQPHHQIVTTNFRIRPPPKMQQPCAVTSLLHCLLPSFKEQLASTIHQPHDHHHKLRQVTTSVTPYAMLWYGDEDGGVINNTKHEGGGGGGKAS